MRKAREDPEPAERWAVFLRNHREVIAAMDFFTVPTLSFGVLYCFFVMAHDRRRILHINATPHPTSSWTSQQLREAFPYGCAPKYLIFDRASNFDGQVIDTVMSFGIQPKQTSFRSPWQNGIAERFVGSCRRELLDHVIILNERHLKRLMNDYVRYYHEDRKHLGLAKMVQGQVFELEVDSGMEDGTWRSASSLSSRRLSATLAQPFPAMDSRLFTFLCGIPSTRSLLAISPAIKSACCNARSRSARNYPVPRQTQFGS